MKAILVLILMMVAPLAEAQSPWRHVNLQATDGSQIGLDYVATERNLSSQGQSPQILTATETLWVNVRAPELNSFDHVRVVIMTYVAGELGDESLDEVETLDLAFAEPGRFTAESRGARIFRTDFSNYFTYRQEIAVVVNGQWLQDPVNRTSNFRAVLERF